MPTSRMLDSALRYLLPGEETDPMTAPKWIAAAINLAKYIVSAFVFFVCLLVSMTLAESAFRVILVWVMIVYLATLEGGQVAVVSLAAVPRASYEDTHKVTAKCLAVVDKAGAMEKYIMGRQFLVVIVIFVLNIVSTGSTTCESMAFGPMTDVAAAVCSTGLSLTFVTILVAQITSQIVASCCRLDFINNYLMWVNTRLALAIEYSGILHTVHLVRILLARLFSAPDDPGVGAVNIFSLVTNSARFFWVRVLLSLFLLWFSIVAIFHEVMLGHTDSMGSAPGFVNLIIVFVFMMVIGLYEGLQIALCALAHVDVGVLREKSPAAAANCQLTFGTHLESFLIGRQMFVTVFVFFVAGTTTISESWKNNSDYTTFGIGSEYLQAILTSGLPASLITTILGSLIFRIAAAKNPVAYLSNPVVGPAIRICLVVESTGIMQFAWVLSKLFMCVLRFRLDSSILSTSQSSGGADILDVEHGETTGENDQDSTHSPFASPTAVKRRAGADRHVEGDDLDELMIAVGSPISATGSDSEPDSLYRSIFPVGETDGATTPLTGEGLGLRLPLGSPRDVDRATPPTRERGASIQQIYAAAMISGTISPAAEPGYSDTTDFPGSPLSPHSLHGVDFAYSLHPVADEDENSSGASPNDNERLL